MAQFDRNKIAASLYEKLIEHFGPLGIEVTFALSESWSATAAFAFRSANIDTSVPGVYSEMVIYFDVHHAYECHRDPAKFAGVPAAWEQLLVEWVPNLFGRAPAANA